MIEIQFLKPMKKPSKNLRVLFAETDGSTVDSEAPENIFYDPKRLLETIGFKGILENEPFKYITTAGSIWEFYLLRFAQKCSRVTYKQLNKRIDPNETPIRNCRRPALGNPFDKWKSNYKLIENNAVLQKAVVPFANNLVRRKCPIRQNGGAGFLNKRKKAAIAFFNYLIGNTTTHRFIDELEYCTNFQDRLTKLIKKHPKNRLFLTSGLMICLYGGKNVNWVDSKLAKAVYHNLPILAGDTPECLKTGQLLRSKSHNKSTFKPPFKDIYHVNIGNRERVNINFRIQTWIKLLGDTHNASK